LKTPQTGAYSSIVKQQEPFPYPVIGHPLASYALQSISLIGTCFQKAS